MGKAWTRALNRLDEGLALAHLAAGPERPALLAFMFHVLFEDEAAMARHEVDPQQRITAGVFDQFVAYYLAHGYAFVTPADVLRGLDPTRKYALITFDDGYYNNRLALPILRRYGCGATACRPRFSSPPTTCCATGRFGGTWCTASGGGGRCRPPRSGPSTPT